MNILFARYFSASVSGLVFYLFTVFAFMIQLVSLSLESGIGYYAAKNNVQNRRLLGIATMWSVAMSFAAMALFVAFASMFDVSVSYPWYYSLAYILGSMLLAFGNAFCYSKYQFALPGIAALAINVLLIVLLVGLPANLKEYFIPIYFASFLLQGVLLFLLIMTRFGVFPSLHFSLAELADIFRYSLQAFVANMMFLLMNRVDYFFVKRYCLPADLGNYIQVSKIAQLFFILPSMIASVLFPVIAAGIKPAIADTLRTISVMILTTYSGVLIMLIAMGYWIFPWIYGQSFSHMYIAFVLLVPGILAISSLYPYTAYYSALNRIAVNIWGSLIALAVIIAGDLIFIPAYGIEAAALISSAGYLVFQFYVVLVFKKEFRVPLKKLFTLNRSEYAFIIRQLKW